METSYFYFYYSLLFYWKSATYNLYSLFRFYSIKYFSNNKTPSENIKPILKDLHIYLTNGNNIILIHIEILKGLLLIPN